MKYLYTTLLLVLFTVTAQAQHEPYVSYNQTYNDVQVGGAWDIGHEDVKINSFLGLSDHYFTMGSGIDVTSGHLLGVDIFLGVDIKYATSSNKSIAIGTPKIGFTVPYAGSRFNIYTSVNQYGLERTQWAPIGISFRF